MSNTLIIEYVVFRMYLTNVNLALEYFTAIFSNENDDQKIVKMNTKWIMNEKQE